MQERKILVRFPKNPRANQAEVFAKSLTCLRTVRIKMARVRTLDLLAHTVIGSRDRLTASLNILYYEFFTNDYARTTST